MRPFRLIVIITYGFEADPVLWQIVILPAFDCGAGELDCVFTLDVDGRPVVEGRFDADGVAAFDPAAFV